MGLNVEAINMLYETIKTNNNISFFNPEILPQYLTCVRLIVYEYAFKDRKVKFKKEHFDTLANADLQEEEILCPIDFTKIKEDYRPLDCIRVFYNSVRNSQKEAARITGHDLRSGKSTQLNRFAYLT
jgi:hypothetical protein